MVIGLPSRLQSADYFQESAAYRFHLVQASLPGTAKDLLFGGGVGSIEQNIENNRGRYADIAVDPRELVRFESSHNYLVDVLVERGLVVAVLLVLVIVQALRSASDKNSPARALLICTAAYLLVNNINLQMELLLWVGIVWQLTSANAPAPFCGRFAGKRSQAYDG